jgi:Na+/melibiose symporter-like transporter
MTDEKIALDPEKILELEFEYARTTAEQAQDDRTAIMTLYLILVGGVGSAIAAITQTSATSSGSTAPHIVLAVIFFLLGITGFFTLMKLVRLRQAWNDSALAMNQIKDYYRAQFPDLNRAFRWKTETLPPLGKPWTITFNLAVLVAIIDSIAMGVAIYFMDWRVSWGEYFLAWVAFVVFFGTQLAYYFYQLPIQKK